MPAATFFRDPMMPSHAQDHRAHELFLLDTNAERRAPEAPTQATRFARVLAHLGVRRSA